MEPEGRGERYHMHIYQLDQWKHPHDFELHDSASERRVLWVVGMTLITMAAEIVFGMLFGSMALLADGWHMGTHAVALGIASLAYYLARKYARDRRFTFGTGKVSILGGYTSAVILVVAALLMLIESVERLFAPQAIRFNEAIAVAFIGLLVNLVSALLLQGRHDHDHHSPSPGHTAGEHLHQDGPDDHPDHDAPSHRHPPDHGDHTHGNHPDHGPAGHHGHHQNQDHNLRGAYLHVVADALTSVLAIVALTAGKFWHWVWLDPAMGIVGAVIITQWARGLLRDTGKILLDRDVRESTVNRIKNIIESDADNRVIDLHLWKVGANQLAVIVSVVTHYPQPPDYYKKLLDKVPDMAHITVEVTACLTEPCIRIP
jgi:cation diffusion facilitator family transporter